MPGTMPRKFRDVSYLQARRILLVVGVGILLATAGVAYARRVDPVEVVGTLLFLPIFVALLFWKMPGGLIAGVLAAGAYVLLRAPAIEAVGFDLFARSIVSRAIAFPLFGALGGWASRQMEAALTKLELFDQVDDATGLYNARFFVEDTDLEISRSDRYHTIFSVALIDMPAAPFDALGRRRGDRALRDLGSLIGHSVRKVDRAVHSHAAGRHRLAIVLPETGAEGAQIFTQRLAVRLTEHIAGRGVSIGSGDVSATWLSYPGSDGEMRRLQDEFREIDRLEHPVGAGSSSPPPTSGTGPTT